jgi:hypothetical protein
MNSTRYTWRDKEGEEFGVDFANAKPSIAAVFIKDFHKSTLKWYHENQCNVGRALCSQTQVRAERQQEAAHEGGSDYK